MQTQKQKETQKQEAGRQAGGRWVEEWVGAACANQNENPPQVEWWEQRVSEVSGVEAPGAVAEIELKLDLSM